MSDNNNFALSHCVHVAVLVSCRMPAPAVLAWPAIAIAAPFVRLACDWAVVTGALLLAAAHRLSGPHGRWVLGLAGVAAAGWGALAGGAGAGHPDPITFGLGGRSGGFWGGPAAHSPPTR